MIVVKLLRRRPPHLLVHLRLKTSADYVMVWSRWSAAATVAGECARYIHSEHMPQWSPPHSLSLTLSLPLCCTCCLFPLHTFVHTCTRSHNGCSKFFQGISRLINRLVVWGSSEVQRSRLNPLTGRIISGRWVHTSPVAPRRPPPSPSLPSLDSTK